MGVEALEAKGITWHHLPEVTDQDLEALKTHFKFHHLDYDDIRARAPIAKMDTYKHYLFFTFQLPVVDDEERVVGEPVYVFLGETELVTVTHAQVPELESFFERMKSSAKFRALVLGKGTAYAMYRILFALFRESLTLVSELTQEVRRLEDAIEHRHDKRLTVDLGHARRNVLFLRHLIDPQRSIIANLKHTSRSFIDEEVMVYFDDLHDVLDTVWISTDSLKLIIDGLFDVNEALLSHKTNQVITLLTFVSAALMVPTLVAGFYGMNVGWLPFVEKPVIIGAFYATGLLGMLLIVLFVVRRSRTTR